MSGCSSVTVTISVRVCGSTGAGTMGSGCAVVAGRTASSSRQVSSSSASSVRPGHLRGRRERAAVPVATRREAKPCDEHAHARQERSHAALTSARSAPTDGAGADASDGAFAVGTLKPMKP